MKVVCTEKIRGVRRTREKEGILDVCVVEPHHLCGVGFCLGHYRQSDKQPDADGFGVPICLGGAYPKSCRIRAEAARHRPQRVVASDWPGSSRRRDSATCLYGDGQYAWRKQIWAESEGDSGGGGSKPRSGSTVVLGTGCHANEE